MTWIRLMVLAVAFGLFFGCGDDDSNSADDTSIMDVSGDTQVADSGDTQVEGDVPGDDASQPDVPPTDTAVTDTSQPDTAGDACDPVAQTGCSAGDKCTIDQNGDPACIALTDPSGQAGPGEDCGTTNGDNCVAGYQCIVFDDTQTCHKICRSDGTGCNAEEVCNIFPPSDSDFRYCDQAVACDILTQTGCETDEACLGGNDPSLGFIVLCQPAGTAAQDEACSGANPCVPGATCLSFGGEMKCSTFCDESVGECPGTTTCNDGASIGFEGEFSDIGVCY